ncbi:MAG: Gfo/Idh/MocA family oxidoreductase [Chloroflexi bacterium]|nr:Gfo/Idh/MocA family oxidoreductase [Chloroflexota bacterium]
MALTRRVIVVGLGSIGRRHARLLNARGDLAVELCEPAPANLELAYAEVGWLPTYGTYTEALRTRPELMVIATPHGLHCEQTVRALEQGIHVLCEKPMSDRLADARTMLAAADRARQRSGAVLSIGFMLHFHPLLARLKQLVADGALGAVLHVHYNVGSYITLVNSRSRYQADLEGALLLDYAHQPDFIYWLLGEKPVGVSMAAAQGGQFEHTSMPNVLALTCDYARPLLTTIHLNYLDNVRLGWVACSVLSPEPTGCRMGALDQMLDDQARGLLR